jgi:hypothetical protein
MIANKFFKNVQRFKYLGSRVTNQNEIYEEAKKRLTLQNACYIQYGTFPPPL